MKSSTPFEVLCGLLGVFSGITFFMVVMFERRIDYMLLMGGVFSLIMPPMIRRLQKW